MTGVQTCALPIFDRDVIERGERAGRKRSQEPGFPRFFAELKKLLFPLAEVITPNIPEGEVLSGIKIQSESDMERAAKEIGDSCGCAVLLKGGHSINDANDLLYHNGTFTWFTGKRIDNPNTHGTGCTLSSAIASGLAKGLSLPDAISAAKEYISGALASMMDLGHGSGPLNHAYRI